MTYCAGWDNRSVRKLPDFNYGKQEEVYVPPPCPLCKSENVIEEATYANNGIIGPGYYSYKTNSKLYCGDCGIYFKDIRK